MTSAALGMGHQTRSEIVYQTLLKDLYLVMCFICVFCLLPGSAFEIWGSILDTPGFIYGAQEVKC